MAANKNLSNKSVVPSTPRISRDYELCEEYVELKSNVPPTPPPSPALPSADDLSKEIELLRSVVLSSRGSRSSRDIKHIYGIGNALTPTDGAAVFGLINTVATGTGQNTRAGNAIFNHSVTIRITSDYIPAATASLAVIQPSQYRIFIWRDSVPCAAGVPTYANVFVTGAVVPIVNPTTLFATLGEADVNAVRNPNTFDRYHILYDETKTLTGRPIGLSATTGAIVGSHHETIHIDFNNSKTTYFSTGSTDIVTNQLNIGIASNGASTFGGNIVFDFTTDFTFSDAPET